MSNNDGFFKEQHAVILRLPQLSVCVHAYFLLKVITVSGKFETRGDVAVCGVINNNSVQCEDG